MHQALGDVVPASWPLANPVLRLSALGCGLSPLCVPGCFSFMPSELLSTALPFHPLLAWNSHLLHLEKYFYFFRTWLRWILKGDISLSLSVSSLRSLGTGPEMRSCAFISRCSQEKGTEKCGRGMGKGRRTSEDALLPWQPLGLHLPREFRRQRRRHVGSLWSGAKGLRHLDPHSCQS